MVGAAFTTAGGARLRVSTTAIVFGDTVAAIRDTDGGRWDDDTEFDRVWSLLQAAAQLGDR